MCVRVCVRVCVYITSHQPIGFSRQKGARKVADLCLPVFDVIDRMYPSLIASGNLEAFAAVPPILYQVWFVTFVTEVSLYSPRRRAAHPLPGT